MTMARPKVLVIDDDPGVVSWLVDSLPDEGIDAVGETSALHALELVQAGSFDLVVSDVEMPELRGIDLLHRIQSVRSQQMVLLITAFGSIDTAVEAVRAGAVDFLAKPFPIEALALAIRRALRERQLRREIVRLRASSSSSDEVATGIVARSKAMLQALDLTTRAARSHLPVLLTGESGVGKGALARLIHARSDRAASHFVQINCAALPSGIAEAELFGVRRGAFTDAREDRPGVFEQAHQGTLFLDEVGELPLDIQPKLLQALESNRVRPVGGTTELPADVRIVAATNVELESEIRERRFRADLYHRLNVVRIHIPPLRTRVEDIEPLVDLVLQRIGERSGGGPIGISVQALRWLEGRPWPGNVRELVNAIERAAALTEHEVLTVGDFEVAPCPAGAGSFLDDAARGELTLADLERAYVKHVLGLTAGHKARAAGILGLDRRTLYRKAAELEAGGAEDDLK